ncbi:MAG: hypothetical protein C4542_05185 [Dehalococcoidia bacterium]|nr:MAG: hypothetical protein C4542_05185 [Dehalococcoidia bacterium]
MPIHLQSFFYRRTVKPVYSIARWQPGFCKYPVIEPFVPVHQGRAIRHYPPDKYLTLYAEAVKSRLGEVENAINNLKRLKDATLCCWCNQQRQKKYEKLFCHTILVGFLLEHHGIPVVYRDGRENPIWDIEDRKRFLSLIY